MTAKLKIAHYTEVTPVDMGDAAPGTTLRWLIDKEHDGAPVYAMRYVDIKPGGNSPRHAHPYEHENYILSGKGQLLCDGEWYDLKPGDAVLVPPDVEHQYKNAGDENFVFLCSIPV